MVGTAMTRPVARVILLVESGAAAFSVRIEDSGNREQTTRAWIAIGFDGRQRHCLAKTARPVAERINHTFSRLNCNEPNTEHAVGKYTGFASYARMAVC